MQFVMSKVRELVRFVVVLLLCARIHQGSRDVSVGGSIILESGYSVVPFRETQDPKEPARGVQNKQVTTSQGSEFRKPLNNPNTSRLRQKNINKSEQNHTTWDGNSLAPDQRISFLPFREKSKDSVNNGRGKVDAYGINRDAFVENDTELSSAPFSDSTDPDEFVGNSQEYTRRLNRPNVSGSHRRDGNEFRNNRTASVENSIESYHDARNSDDSMQSKDTHKGQMNRYKNTNPVSRSNRNNATRSQHEYNGHTTLEGPGDRFSNFAGFSQDEKWSPEFDEEFKPTSVSGMENSAAHQWDRTLISDDASVEQKDNSGTPFALGYIPDHTYVHIESDEYDPSRYSETTSSHESGNSYSPHFEQSDNEYENTDQHREEPNSFPSSTTDSNMGSRQHRYSAYGQHRDYENPKKQTESSFISRRYPHQQYYQQRQSDYLDRLKTQNIPNIESSEGYASKEDSGESDDHAPSKSNDSYEYENPRPLKITDKYEEEVRNSVSDHELPRDVPVKVRLRGDLATPAPDSGVQLGFTPRQIYYQVRRYDSEVHLPKSAALEEAETAEEVINAPRLREVVSHKKTQEVYEEQGYEDAAYDHGGYKKAGEHHELTGPKERTDVVHDLSTEQAEVVQSGNLTTSTPAETETFDRRTRKPNSRGTWSRRKMTTKEKSMKFGNDTSNREKDERRKALINRRRRIRTTTAVPVTSSIISNKSESKISNLKNEFLKPTTYRPPVPSRLLLNSYREMKPQSSNNVKQFRELDIPKIPRAVDGYSYEYPFANKFSRKVPLYEVSGKMTTRDMPFTYSQYGTTKPKSTSHGYSLNSYFQQEPLLKPKPKYEKFKVKSFPYEIIRDHGEQFYNKKQNIKRGKSKEFPYPIVSGGYQTVEKLYDSSPEIASFLNDVSSNTKTQIKTSESDVMKSLSIFGQPDESPWIPITTTPYDLHGYETKRAPFDTEIQRNLKSKQKQKLAPILVPDLSQLAQSVSSSYHIQHIYPIMKDDTNFKPMESKLKQYEASIYQFDFPFEESEARTETDMEILQSVEITPYTESIDSGVNHPTTYQTTPVQNTESQQELHSTESYSRSDTETLSSNRYTVFQRTNHSHPVDDSYDVNERFNSLFITESDKLLNSRHPHLSRETTKYTSIEPPTYMNSNRDIVTQKIVAKSFNSTKSNKIRKRDDSVTAKAPIIVYPEDYTSSARFVEGLTLAHYSSAGNVRNSLPLNYHDRMSSLNSHLRNGYIHNSTREKRNVHLSQSLLDHRDSLTKVDDQVGKSVSLEIAYGTESTRYYKSHDTAPENVSKLDCLNCSQNVLDRRQVDGGNKIKNNSKLVNETVLLSLLNLLNNEEAKQTRDVADRIKREISKDKEELVNVFLGGTTTEIAVNVEKYPFYKQISPEGLSKYSVLRYISNPRQVPQKISGRMSFYESTKNMECVEPSPPQNIVPQRQDGDWAYDPQPKAPRIQNLGEKIQCLKRKFFGSDPLDNPFFKEDIIGFPEVYQSPARGIKFQEVDESNNEYELLPQPVLKTTKKKRKRKKSKNIKRSIVLYPSSQYNDSVTESIPAILVHGDYDNRNYAKQLVDDTEMFKQSTDESNVTRLLIRLMPEFVRYSADHKGVAEPHTKRHNQQKRSVENVFGLRLNSTQRNRQKRVVHKAYLAGGFKNRNEDRKTTESYIPDESKMPSMYVDALSSLRSLQTSSKNKNQDKNMKFSYKEPTWRRRKEELTMSNPEIDSLLYVIHPKTGEGKWMKLLKVEEVGENQISTTVRPFYHYFPSGTSNQEVDSFDDNSSAQTVIDKPKKCDQDSTENEIKTDMPYNPDYDIYHISGLLKQVAPLKANQVEINNLQPETDEDDETTTKFPEPHERLYYYVVE